MTSADAELEAPTITRLGYIESLRGIAAVAVCMNHLVYLVPHMPPGSPGGELGPRWLRLLLRPFAYGPEMVALFLVVSGFSLYYSEMGRRRRGSAPTLSEFARRRAWRILPTYYVALLLGVAATVMYRRVSFSHGEPVEVHLSGGGLLSHLVLVHNLQASWVFQANAPLWSIAYEAQVYILFPLILWLGRRIGLLRSVLLVALPLSAYGHSHPPVPIFGLVGWFCLGIAVAHVCMTGWRVPRLLLTCLAAAAAALAFANPAPLRNTPSHDLLWGTLFVGVIGALHGGRRLHGRALRGVGKVSYSLYAMHYPLVVLLLVGLQRVGLDGLGLLGAMVGVGLPLSLCVAAGSYRLVEAPSLARVRAVRSR